MSKVEILKEYNLVYQGGLHDVFCDGSEHIKMKGGFTGLPISYLKPTWPKLTTRCDCVRWKEHEQRQ